MKFSTRGSMMRVLVALGLVLMLAGAVLASDVDVAVVDVTAPIGSVTLAPGESGAITINMTVTGRQGGTATFQVYRDWVLSDGVFTGSNPQTFTVNPRAASDPPTTFSTSGTVSVAAGQNAGKFTLAVGAFNITNTDTPTLKARNPSNYEVTVEIPAPSDTTPPVIVPTIVGTLGDNDWYVSDVTVSWSVTDPESGIASSSGCGETTISADTEGITLTCSATNGAGLSNSVSVTIKRDATPPTISGSASPAANANGWNNTDVTVSFSCSDATSGIASCEPNQTLSGEGAGLSVIGTAVDNAGNSASATVSGINIDKTAPVVTITCPSSPVILGSSASASWSASDSLSGLATPGSGSIALDTSSVGAKTVTAPTATDLAGNESAPATCSHSVIYNWTGFFRPVDNLPTLNVAKAGSAIPVKFSLSGFQGLNIFASGYPASQKIACDTTAPQDGIEEAVTAGGSSLSYDATADQYIYVWKTDKLWAGTCRQLVVRLIDGSELRANFRFTKAGA